MATFTWTLQGGTPTTIDATDKVEFAGGTFGSAITVGEYQSSTHVRSVANADDSSGNSPKNVKYVASGTCDIGSGTVNLNTLANGDATLKINFSDAASVSTSSAVFYAYDGTTTTAVPTGVTFQAAEIGDTNWTNAEGSAAALTINDDTAATSHDYYIAVSASPESVGTKTAFALRIELTYS